MVLDGERASWQPTIFHCPICDEPLAPEGAALTCPRGHTFDVAREGYVNLLRGKPRGDTREMARARRTFLERGWYAPLARRLCALAAVALAEPGAPGAGAAPGVLDAGCGEGYYLGQLMEALDQEASGGAEVPAHGTASRLASGERTYLGVDISKDAVRMAARRYPGARFVVADVTRRLPVATGAVALLLDVFAPRNAGEFGRVVAPGGGLLVAIPGPAHLAELRDALSLLGIEPEKEQHVTAQLAEAFEPISAEGIEYTMRLDRAAATALVAMTPSAWHRTEETAAALASLGDDTAVTASFRALRFRRR